MKQTVRVFFFFFYLTILLPVFATAQARIVDRVYKTVDTTRLSMRIFYPPTYREGDSRPAIVLFFGGGWVNGSLTQFEQQAQHLASEGMIAITPEYRTRNKHQTSPFEAVKDGRSAIRFVRAHAKELGVDPGKLAAGGGSAGGHVAAAADLTNLDEAGEDLSVSARPNALVLFNPVFNNGPGEYGYDRVAGRFGEISPFHNIRKGAAPTVVFFGTRDALVSVATAKAYKERMESVGSRCDLFLYEGQGHGFFNFKQGTENTYYQKTLAEADLFLRSIGYLKN